MIYELNPSQYEGIAHLLVGNRINLEIKGVVEGYNPGWVFVDNVMMPQTAMVWSQGIKGFYFLGEHQSPEFISALHAYIRYILSPRLMKMGIESFEFSGTSPGWDAVLKDVFKDHGLRISSQYVYRTGEAMPVAKVDTDGGSYELRRVDKDLLSQTGLDMELVRSSVLDWWGSVDQFSKHGLGYCVLHDGQAVCSCVSSSFDGAEVQSHIVTDESHRLKGLASWAVSAFMEESLSSDLKLYWDCMEKNAGSRALAEKMGYSKAYEYPLFEFDL